MITKRITITDLESMGFSSDLLSLDLSSEKDDRIKHRKIFSKILALANLIANVGKQGPANVVEISSGDLLGVADGSIAGMKIVTNGNILDDVQKIIVRRDNNTENIEVHLRLKLR